MEGKSSIVERTVDYREGETALQGFVAYDGAIETPRPGVMIVHQWQGIGEYEKRRARQLAGMGYVAFACDIFGSPDVYGPSVRPTEMADAARMAGLYRGDRPLFRRRLIAGLDAMKALPEVDATRTVAIGYCFGGTGVLELARSGAETNGVISFHGGLDSPTPADGAQIRCPVLVCHGADDPFISKENLGAFLAEMQSNGVDCRFRSYPGAVHSFTHLEAGDDPSKGFAYHAEADRQSFAEMEAFFKDVF